MSDSIAEENKYRSYICPCGKTYLSYPALFTHVKQKHDGKVSYHAYSRPATSYDQEHSTSVVVLAKMLPAKPKISSTPRCHVFDV